MVLANVDTHSYFQGDIRNFSLELSSDFSPFQFAILNTIIQYIIFIQTTP